MNRFQRMTQDQLTAWWVFYQMDSQDAPNPAAVFEWIDYVRRHRENVEVQLHADYGDHAEPFGSN